ncbi:MAG TPA: hypothetical protein VFT59_00855 [Candidatus Saccharimonadales bacterium]|nr:hypothetical protein [Candidatus Saccharimonadales bacterium]
MGGFEHRIALPGVLDNVHRRTVMRTLGRAGANFTSGSWQEVDAAALAYRDKLDQGDILRDVEYVGENPDCYGAVTPIGPLFGEMYTLTMSGRTPYFANIDTNSSLGADKFKRRIGLFKSPFDEFPDFTSIYLLRDMPPIAVHADAHIQVVGDTWMRGEVLQDTEIIRRAEAAFGGAGVEYIQENIARQAIRALLTDTSRTLNITDYYS